MKKLLLFWTGFYKVARRLGREGKITKARIVTKKNSQAEKIEVALPGGIFTKSNIFEILDNRVYIRVRKLHNEYFEGIKKAIVAADKFGKVKKLNWLIK